MLELYRQLLVQQRRLSPAGRLADGDPSTARCCSTARWATDRHRRYCALTLFALGCDRHTVMEEYLLTRGMWAEVEFHARFPRLDELTARGRQNSGNHDRFMSLILLPRFSQIDDHTPASMQAGEEYQLTPQTRGNLSSRRGFLEGNPLPFSGNGASVDGLHSRSGKNVIFVHTSHFTCLAESTYNALPSAPCFKLIKACAALTSPTT